jgi:membrane protease YdiL (CAAX protease family)
VAVSDHPDRGFVADPPPRPDGWSGAAPEAQPPARPDVWVQPGWEESPAIDPGVWWRPRDAVAVYLMAGGVSLFLGIALRAVPGLHGPARQAIGGVLQELGLLAIVIWWIRTFGDGRLGPLGVPPRKPWGDVGTGLGVGVLAVFADGLVARAVENLVQAITGHAPHMPPSVTNDLHGPWLPVMAPICEETLFRGFILQGLERGLRGPWPVLVSAAFFAFVHVYPLVMPSVFVIGVLFALLFMWRRSLLASMTAHATVNLVVVMVALAQR